MNESSLLLIIVVLCFIRIKKLLDWDYMNFQTTVNINTSIYAIQKLLHNKHGRIKDLVLYKDSIINEENEICNTCVGSATNCSNDNNGNNSNEMKTLKECGFVGGLMKEDAPKYTICYDFKPVNANDCRDPVLLSWMG